MNERIKELISQCEIVKYDFEGCLVEAGFDADKFAELIVRECCQALNPMLRDMISRGQGVDLIKEHFGVEK